MNFIYFLDSCTITLPLPVIIFSHAGSHMCGTYRGFNEFDAFCLKIAAQRGCSIQRFCLLLLARRAQTSGTNGGFNEFHAFLQPRVFYFVFIYAKCSYLKKWSLIWRNSYIFENATQRDCYTDSLFYVQEALIRDLVVATLINSTYVWKFYSTMLLHPCVLFVCFQEREALTRALVISALVIFL